MEFLEPFQTNDLKKSKNVSEVLTFARAIFVRMAYKDTIICQQIFFFRQAIVKNILSN